MIITVGVIKDENSKVKKVITVLTETGEKRALDKQQVSYLLFKKKEIWDLKFMDTSLVGRYTSLRNYPVYGDNLFVISNQGVIVYGREKVGNEYIIKYLDNMLVKGKLEEQEFIKSVYNNQIRLVNADIKIVNNQGGNKRSVKINGIRSTTK